MSARKLNSDDLPQKPMVFKNKLDNERYNKIFDAVDTSKIIQSLGITHCSSETIAVFANGKFEPCGNDQCNNHIPTLHRNKVIYNYNHQNSDKIGYKISPSGKLYCEQCMILCTECSCRFCEYEPESDENLPTFKALIFSGNKCDLCARAVTCTDGAIYCEYEQKVCDRCDGKYCGDCMEVRECCECYDLFCDECIMEQCADANCDHDDADCCCGYTLKYVCFDCDAKCIK